MFACMMQHIEDITRRCKNMNFIFTTRKKKSFFPSRPVIFFLLCRQDCFSGNFCTYKQQCKVCLYIFIPFLFSFYAIYCTYIVACVINLPFLALIFHFSLFLFVCFLFSFLYQWQEGSDNVIAYRYMTCIEFVLPMSGPFWPSYVANVVSWP